MSRVSPIFSTSSLIALLCASLAGCAGAEKHQSSPVDVQVSPVSDSAPPMTPAVDVSRANEPGQLVALPELLVPGKVTIVEYYADWCVACRGVESSLLAKLNGRRDVAVRKVHIGDDVDSPVAVQHQVKAVPLMRIYDATGEERFSLEGADARQAGELSVQIAAQMKR